MTRKPTIKDVARFFDKVKITDHCWLWTTNLNGRWCGRFTYRGKTVGAHQFSYELFVGLIEQGKHILHRKECGNSNCVNPHHLYQGTHADNMRDMRIWGNVALGEDNGSAKLSEKDVLAIRRIHNDKGYRYRILADMFGVCISQIHRIVKGKRWKHLLSQA